MSSLKRSLSSSSIPRLSRLPVRQSGASKPPRSSSVRSSNVNTNLLTVYGSGTMGRASSCTNLVTPSRRMQCSTPSSGARSISKDSIVRDKDWQKNQFQRVRMFFHGIDSEISLKPLTIRTYVYSMDILFKQFDNRISITMANYKDSVSDYLKSFKYPHSMKPSVMKSPAVPSSWPYILQIWTWLLDCIDILQNPESVLLTQVIDGESLKFRNNGVYYMAERFKSFNSEEEKEVDVDKRFQLNMAQLLDVDNTDNTKQMDEDERYLFKQLETLHATHSATELSIKTLSDKVSNLRNTNATNIQKKYDHRNKLLDQMKELLIKSKNLQDHVTENEGEFENLRDIVLQQTHTKEDLIKMKNKIQEQSNSQKYKNECRKELARLIQDYDVKLTCRKQAFDSTVYQINNKIAPLICKAPDLRELKIPEDIRSEPNLDCYIKDFSEQMKKLKVNMNIKSMDLTARCRTVEEDNKKGIAKLEDLETKIQAFSETQREHENAFDKKREVLQKQIDKKRRNIAELEQTRKELVVDRPNIDLLQRKLEASVKKEIELEALGDEILSCGEDLIVTANNNIKSIMDTEKTIMDNINQSLENSLNIDLTTLDESINALKEERNKNFPNML